MPHVYEPLPHQKGLGYASDPARCSASVHQGRMGMFQCSRKVVETLGGHGWCRQHANEYRAQQKPSGGPDDQRQTWYEVGRWDDELKPIKVSKETERFIWVNGRQQAKRNDYYSTFPSRDEAVAFIIARMRRKIEHATKEAEDATEALAKIIEQYGDPAAQQDAEPDATPNQDPAR